MLSKRSGTTYYYLATKNNTNELSNHSINGAPLTLSNITDVTIPLFCPYVFVQNTNITKLDKFDAILCAYRSNDNKWVLGYLLKQTIYSSFVAEACINVKHNQLKVSNEPLSSLQCFHQYVYNIHSH
jgi:hypothetical protein